VETAFRVNLGKEGFNLPELLYFRNGKAPYSLNKQFLFSIHDTVTEHSLNEQFLLSYPHDIVPV
jgi:hypothetical protein